METGKPFAADWKMTQSPPHERERDRILQIIDQHYVAQLNKGVFGITVCNVLAEIVREIMEIKKEAWDEIWEPNYWDSHSEPISASPVEEKEKQG